MAQTCSTEQPSAAQVVRPGAMCGGEELAAWIIVREGHQLTEEAVRAFCRGNVARHKMPRDVRFIAPYPLTVTGKVQKFRLREAAEHELGLAKLEGY